MEAPKNPENPFPEAPHPCRAEGVQSDFSTERRHYPLRFGPTSQADACFDIHNEASPSAATPSVRDASTRTFDPLPHYAINNIKLRAAGTSR